MSGFGKTLEETKITSKLYRKVSADNMMNEGELCTSTENSTKLIGVGDFCLVYESKERLGSYTNMDADAGKNFGYDEFRTELYTSDVSFIIYPDFWNDEIDEELYDTDKDPMVWISNLEDAGFILISESQANENIIFNW